MTAFQDLTGQRFGRLTVVEKAGKTKHGNARWLCRCNCGATKKIAAGELKSLKTVSCGCWSREQLIKRSTTHGMHDSKTYRIWGGLIDRCKNPSSPAYKNYGSRGIEVCDRWLKFENFYEDMGECPEGMSIDRINNNGNYELGNCRWATLEEQGNNKRNNRLIEFNGKTQTIAQWAKELGIRRVTLSRRINYHNWSAEKAFTTPVRKKLSKS